MRSKYEQSGHFGFYQLIENRAIESMMILSLLAFLDEKLGLLLSKDELKPENFVTIQKINDLVIKKTAIS